MDYIKYEDIRMFYTFQEEIGSGNFASVHKAIHQEEDVEVAIKSIQKTQNGEDYAMNFLKN